mmetsp:Transcript_3908/g.14768  ORF Transcript_3908/g.14768 Transcript_3908/m.14768 type:complete len:109 (+) Transcript_3908:88-414(+)
MHLTHCPKKNSSARLQLSLFALRILICFFAWNVLFSKTIYVNATNRQCTCNSRRVLPSISGTQDSNPENVKRLLLQNPKCATTLADLLHFDHSTCLDSPLLHFEPQQL